MGPGETFSTGGVLVSWLAALRRNNFKLTPRILSLAAFLAW